MKSSTNRSNLGKLIGVSLGPGAADLLTLRARQTLERADVVAHMHATGTAGLALEIAQPLLKADVTVLGVAVPMGADMVVRQACYDAAMDDFRTHLDAGRDVAFVCEGDSLFYGSFQYVMERLQGAYGVEVIPGVTSVQACSAVAALALTRGDDIFQALPATLSEGALAARLKDPHTAVAILKIGRHLDKVKRALRRAGRLDGAKWVERASQDGEKCLPLTAVDGEAAYFSLVLSPAPGVQPVSAVPEGAVVLCLNAAGLETAKTVQKAVPGAQLWGRKGRIARDAVDRIFDRTSETLRGLYENGMPIVAIMSAGIVMRVLAPMLADKRAEPPVLAVSSDGASVVPLLGGHRGANRMARAVAAVTGGFAAITTAGDTDLGVALDEPPAGWGVSNVERAKDVAAARLNGDEVYLKVESGEADWLAPAGFGDAGSVGVRISHEMVNNDKELVLHPPVLALGVGCERNCPPRDLIGLVDETLKHHNISEESIACVASIDVKADEPAVHALAEKLGVPARFYSAAELESYAGQIKNPSDIVFAEVGCHGVAEGAALAASGGKLTIEKTKSKRATCAVGLSHNSIDPILTGKGRGRLFVVGIGPGTEAWRTPQVTKIISEVSDVVAYGFYLDLIPDLIKGKTRHTSILSEEEARVRQALDLAAEGRDVALISSGDIGIYAMATLVFELLDREDRADWNRLQIQVEPGISAFQAAAARIGAPVGHDFCLISLSDLLTPWAVIERRLKAAAEGGFVVSFYNPVSKRRRTQLAKARDILLTKRRPDTPVILARQLGRPDEKIDVITLGELTPDHADMLTLVMVGGEDTRLIERGQNRWVYTPRGYGGKMDQRSGSVVPAGRPGLDAEAEGNPT